MARYSILNGGFSPFHSIHSFRGAVAGSEPLDDGANSFANVAIAPFRPSIKADESPIRVSQTLPTPPSV